MELFPALVHGTSLSLSEKHWQMYSRYLHIWIE